MVALAAQDLPAAPRPAAVAIAADGDQGAPGDLRLELAVEAGAAGQVGGVDEGLDAVPVEGEVVLDGLGDGPAVGLGVAEEQPFAVDQHAVDAAAPLPRHRIPRLEVAADGVDDVEQHAGAPRRIGVGSRPAGGGDALDHGQPRQRLAAGPERQDERPLGTGGAFACQLGEEVPPVCAGGILQVP